MLNYTQQKITDFTEYYTQQKINLQQHKPQKPITAANHSHPPSHLPHPPAWHIHQAHTTFKPSLVSAAPGSTQPCWMEHYHYHKINLV